MRTIPQRELRNHSGEILRQAEAGGQFTITVDGRPVAVLGPPAKPTWISRETILARLNSLPPDRELRADVAGLGGTLEELGDPWSS